MFRADFKLDSQLSETVDRRFSYRQSYRVIGSARIRVKQSVKRDNNGKSVLAAHSSKPFVVVIYANATGHLDHLDGSMSVIVAERIDTDQKTSGKQALAIRYDGLALVYPAGRPVWEPSLPVL